MTKKQLSKESGISVSRIGQLMVNMVSGIDYIEEKRGDHDIRIEFTESGISKVMNRNTKGGRTKIERVRRPRGRPRKVAEKVIEIEVPESLKQGFREANEYVSRAFRDLDKWAEKSAEKARQALTEISKTIKSNEKGGEV